MEGYFQGAENNPFPIIIGKFYPWSRVNFKHQNAPNLNWFWFLQRLYKIIVFSPFFGGQIACLGGKNNLR
jgi:hypothetical protein